MIKKKICFIVSSPLTATSFLESHFEVLSNYFDVYLVANLNGNEMSSYSNRYLIEVKNIEINRKINIVKDIKALINLREYLIKGKFDAINTFTPKAGLIGIVSGKLAGIKHRVHFFTGQVWYTKKGFLKFFLILLDKLVVKLSTNIVVDGRPQQQFLIANGILTENNSITIGRGTISGIDHNKFSPKPEIRKELRSSLNYTDNDIVFMFLGRMNIDKGILDLALAFVRHSEIHPNVKLLLVGPDEENIAEKLKDIFTDTNNYFLFGSTETPEDILQVCDIFCLPSHREAFGLSIIEASACEKPIICSDTYGLRDTIIDGVTGLRHITHNIDSIFEKMNQLVSDQTLRKKMGKAGREFTKEYFSKQKLTGMWLDYFNCIIR